LGEDWFEPKKKTCLKSTGHKPTPKYTSEYIKELKKREGKGFLPRFWFLDRGSFLFYLKEFEDEF